MSSRYIQYSLKILSILCEGKSDLIAYKVVMMLVDLRSVNGWNCISSSVSSLYSLAMHPNQDGEKCFKSIVLL